jgi:DNA polymerase I-like protein with 3'-5' exonuclease and polymerase domains
MTIQNPLFQPPSEWVCPEAIDYKGQSPVAIDLETYDPGIKDHGPGWATGNGKVVGVALAWEGFKGYWPIDHDAPGNYDKNVFKKQLQDLLDRCPAIVCHNAMYDVGWMRRMGMKIKCKVWDTMLMAPILDENRMRYSLNELSKDYLGEKKSEALLYEAAKDWGVDAKNDMWRLPPMYVGPYAEQDAELALKLYEVFMREIEAQDLSSINELEHRVLPVLIDMKWHGVRVDIDEAEQAKAELLKKENTQLKKIKDKTGVSVNVWEAKSISKMFDALDLPYARTELSGAPKFDKHFLRTHEHPLVQSIAQAREFNKARTTFIDTIIKHAHKGRIHAEINQLRGDGGGTVTGRLSYNTPNLQQVPASPVLGSMIRSIFKPEEGKSWGAFDYSQQEPRLVVHLASLTAGGLRGADEFVNAYHDDPNTDFHTMVSEMAKIDRKKAKTINLGLFYGMGKGKLSSELGLSPGEAEDLFEKYHKRVPFVKEMIERTMKKAADIGHVRTLLGRKCRFDKWEPSRYGVHRPLPRDEAEREHGKQIRRAFTYKALNKIIQGSAADMTKQAMADLHDEGIVPHIQVHDELDCSFEDEIEKDKILEIMRNAVKLEVPVKLDAEVGPSWGKAK